MANRTVTIETNKGTIKFTLHEDLAPITTANFAELAGKKFYDGLKFHRYEPGFVIQGGCPWGNGMGGSDKKIPLEVSPNLKHGEAGGVAGPADHRPAQGGASAQRHHRLRRGILGPVAAGRADGP